MFFPKSPCYACKTPIQKEGIVAAIQPKDLARLVGKLSSSDALGLSTAPFINALTWQIVSQCQVTQQGSACAEVNQSLQDLLIDRGAHKYRLETILRAPPAEQVYMLLHESCLPRELEGAYSLDLSILSDSPAAIRQTIDLSRKPQYNGRGWGQLLESIYG